MIKRPIRRLPFILALGVLTACAPALAPIKAPEVPPKASLTLKVTTFERLPGWKSDAHGNAVVALRRSCARLMKQPSGRSLGAGGIGGRISDWQSVCATAAKLPQGDAAARGFFEKWFVPHLAIGSGGSKGLFTGYYEAELRGSRTRHGPYQVPIYKKPEDLVVADLGAFRSKLKGQNLSGRVLNGKLIPYQNRAEIDSGALAGRGLELLWVDDPVDAFFLHVQGSGRVLMDDGKVVRLGFAGRNGHNYVSIGRLLIKRGEIPKEAVSMRSIREWIGANPNEGAKLMNGNPSYIFFTVRKGEGPIGAQGAALTPGRSLAVDKRFIPFGIPIWLDTSYPMDQGKPLRRLVIAQDTGGAIKGPVRGDLFWGYGSAAGKMAGEMKESGRYYLLLPRTVAKRN